jgi:uncharacterized protein
MTAGSPNEAHPSPARGPADQPGRVDTLEALTELFGRPGMGAVNKEIDHLDRNCASFLAHCPFIALGTTNPDGTGDVSPKGGTAGFVKLRSPNQIAWGELPGNNRLDGYRNIVRDPRVGLLAMIPGIDETLRINGTAWVTTDPAIIDEVALDGRRPKVAIVVDVAEAFIHCAKAFRRSSLWRPEQWPATDDMATISCMIVEHIGGALATSDPDGSKTQEMLERDYAATLWNAPATPDVSTIGD